MRRLLPWISFLLMEAVLLSLGIWQLQRKAWKDELLALYARNQAMSSIVDARAPAGKSASMARQFQFRKAAARCSPWTGSSTVLSGYNQSGKMGWRTVLLCKYSAGPDLLLDTGWHANLTPELSLEQAAHALRRTADGDIQATLIDSPAAMAAAAQAWPGKSFLPLLAIAEPGPEGLAPTRLPGPADIPNNHLAYAIQWFCFAGVLGVIFVIYQRRQRVASSGTDA